MYILLNLLIIKQLTTKVIAIQKAPLTYLIPGKYNKLSELCWNNNKLKLPFSANPKYKYLRKIGFNRVPRHGYPY